MLMLPAGPPLLTPDEMRGAEAAAIAAGTPALVLMERAAAAGTAAIMAFAPRGRALVLCGPGNNGGDGYGVALGLRARGVSVDVIALAPPATEPAQTMAARWDGPVLGPETLADTHDTLIVDALFGTGLGRPLPPAAEALLAALQGSGPVVALDIASGIDALTGEAHGQPLAADLTIAFGAAKHGHVQGAGARTRGRLVVADIGAALPDVPIHLVSRPLRGVPAPDTHKFARGQLLVVGSHLATGGAAALAASAALRSGAGVVTLAGDAATLPNAIMRRDDAAARTLLDDRRTTALLLGPGLAEDGRSRDWLNRALAASLPVVLDAMALRLADPAMLAAARAPMVLTPHEGEFRALFGDIGPNRIAAVQAAASLASAVVLLKGPETIIAAPDGRVLVNTHASPHLATAGSGDVLAGIIAGLIAQGMDPFRAAAAAAWLHGEAGFLCGPGLIADDLVAALPSVLASL
ncbi:hydroxyethylthiazole kinase-like uncharacterized protein yjeF [Polymorphobacter multimanifer]|uniref:Bifunctional NAD(P)H-hydrate repair enzyme n=1 Tax=Polymorphobacter multimanifer TaxID=1070431 RepID=A0A841L0F0_9SPHN|nr:NAD(P)H-hydrate dehydratase [Polymorphobacter multimanifer]MBB6226014.1 hydroxyethylthiazole kinase-like uncharacterized protein yjeF [Polymorphobacter multimanifer]